MQRFNLIKQHVMNVIRGNETQHGTIACLRCKWLDNRIAELQQELAATEGQAALHVAQHHVLGNSKVRRVF